jgi:hypothetical protein
MNQQSNEKIAIIGAGPAGYAAAITARRLGYVVELVDPWIFADPEINSTTDIHVKTRFGSTKIHEYPEKYLRSENEQLVASTQVVGGFSTVWGAGLSFETNLFEGHYDRIHIETAEKTVRSIFQKFGGPHFVSERFKKLLNDSKNGFYMSELGVRGTSCKLTGLCMTGCAENAIWSCEPLWKQLVSTEITLRRGFARQLKEFDNHVSIDIDIDDHTETLNYDYVLVACGAIASASLGQRSEFFPDYVEIGETAISYLPIVIAGRLKPYTENSFTLSQVFYRKKVPKENHDIWMSIFEASSFLKKQAEYKLGWPSKLIPKILWGYLGVAIHYTPEVFSDKILIKLEKGISVVSSQKTEDLSREYFQRLYWIIRKEFFKNRLFFHPKIRLRGKSAASYHIGHLTSNGLK